MARTTPERESIIDAFDAVITFSYAYEWQKLHNNGIDELSDLADQIIAEVEKEYPPLLTSPEERFDVICSILNRLNAAVVADSCPKAIEPGDFWINVPDSFSGEQLIHSYQDEYDDIVMIVMVVISSLNKSLPDEIKPFVTIEQVDAMLSKTCDELKHNNEMAQQAKFRMPIHKELMATMIHQHFLRTFSLGQTTYEEVVAYSELSAGYCEKAIAEFVKMAANMFAVATVIKFFPLGKTIKVEIDRYYTWAQLCFPIKDYNKLLSIYSDVKELFLDKGVKSIGKDDSLKVKLKNIIAFGAGFKRLEDNPKGSLIRYLFDSNRTPVLVDGRPIQNHLVMIFPYDKPLPGAQEKLKDFARYIGNRVNVYVREYGDTEGYEKEIKEAVACKNIDLPYTRFSLVDSSSVLPQICSLLCFEYERSSENASHAKKRQSLDVYEMIKNHGFKFSIESVESARKDKKNKMNRVVKKFHNP